MNDFGNFGGASVLQLNKKNMKYYICFERCKPGKQAGQAGQAGIKMRTRIYRECINFFDGNRKKEYTRYTTRHKRTKTRGGVVCDSWIPRTRMFV